MDLAGGGLCLPQAFGQQRTMKGRHEQRRSMYRYIHREDLANHWIKDASISRRFVPASVTVRVVEHRPTATLFLKDKPYYVSEEGKVFAAATENAYGIMIQASDYQPANGSEDLDLILASALKAVSVVQSRGLKVKDLVIEAGDEFPVEVPENYMWMTWRQLNTLIKFNNYVNVEARSLVSTLSFLSPPASQPGQAGGFSASNHR